MNYCLLTMLAKPLLVKLLGYLKVYVFDRKFWLLYWKSQFFLSTGGRHFLTKPENSNSTIHRAVGFSCPRPPFSASAPCPGPVEGEGSTTWGKNGEKKATGQVSGLLQTRGRDLQCRSLQKRGRGLRQWGIIYDAVHLKKGKKSPCQSKVRQKVFKKRKGDNIFTAAGGRTARHSHKRRGGGIRWGTCRQRVGLTVLSFLQMAPSWLLADKIVIINHSPHPNSRACFQILIWLLKNAAWITVRHGTLDFGHKTFLHGCLFLPITNNTEILHVLRHPSDDKTTSWGLFYLVWWLPRQKLRSLYQL